MDGFSLVELVAVMAILSILAGAAIPTMRWIEPARHNVATSRVRNALVHAQQRAVATSRAVVVDIDDKNDTLQVYIGSTVGDLDLGELGPLTDPLTRGPLVVAFDSETVGFDKVKVDKDERFLFAGDAVPRRMNGDLFKDNGEITMLGGDVIIVTRDTGLIYVR